MPAPDPGAAREANRLYWETDLAISEIADRLDLSRRALYDAIRPELADADCPDCGAPLVFPNRSARATGAAVCNSCGYSRRITPAPDLAAGPTPDPTAPPGPAPSALREGVPGATPLEPAPAAAEADHGWFAPGPAPLPGDAAGAGAGTLALVGAMLAGAVVGAGAALLLIRPSAE